MKFNLYGHYLLAHHISKPQNSMFVYVRLFSSSVAARYEAFSSVCFSCSRYFANTDSCKDLFNSSALHIGFRPLNLLLNQVARTHKPAASDFCSDRKSAFRDMGCTKIAKHTIKFLPLSIKTVCR